MRWLRLFFVFGGAVIVLLLGVAWEAHSWKEMNTEPAWQRPAQFDQTLTAYVNRLTVESFGGVASMAQRAAYVQDRVVQTRLAIALERYYLKRKEYPERLEELVPEYLSVLPPEVLTGKPMRYARMEPGVFSMWADGWNGMDDHGRWNERDYIEEDDWVWGKP